jgi:pimeloyl-ACP methyl ester carboxylesterase
MRVSVRLWYGDRDGTATLGMGRYFAQHLSNAHLTELHDAAHFLVFPHWVNILHELASLARQLAN